MDSTSKWLTDSTSKWNKRYDWFKIYF